MPHIELGGELWELAWRSRDRRSAVGCRYGRRRYNKYPPKDLQKFLGRLVPGRGRKDKDRRKVLQWIITLTAFEFVTKKDWATLDTLACEAEKGNVPGSTGQRDKQLMSAAIESFLVSFPSDLGRVCDSEKVSLTALGFLLAQTTQELKATARDDALMLATLAGICRQAKLESPQKANFGKDDIRDYFSKFTDESPLKDLANEPRAKDFGNWSRVKDLAPMLPGVSVSENSDGDWSLSIHRVVLEYRPDDPQHGQLLDIDQLLGILERQALNRLGVGRRPLSWVVALFRQTFNLIFPLVSFARGRDRQRNETVDPGPDWLAGNEGQVKGTVSQSDREYWANLLSVYATQFGSYTTLLWQVPALSLTAQAFLMTISLGMGTSNIARLVASFLSIVIAGASISLMHDQRGHAINFGELALRVSKELGLTKVLGRLAVDDAKPELSDSGTVWVGWDHRIYHVWKICL
jgi:hypothetical protein